jgi:hypothetical protein
VVELLVPRRQEVAVGVVEPAENSEKIAASERPTTTSLAASDSLARALNLALGKMTEPLACCELPCSTANFAVESASRSCAFELFLTSTTFDS